MCVSAFVGFITITKPAPVPILSFEGKGNQLPKQWGGKGIIIPQKLEVSTLPDSDGRIAEATSVMGPNFLFLEKMCMQNVWAFV